MYKNGINLAVTKQKIFSLVVIAGLLVAAIAPFIHKNKISNQSHNFSEIAVSQTAQLMFSIYDDHSSDHSESKHCEACHIFSHLYSVTSHTTIVSLVGTVKHYGYTDVFSGRAAESINKPPRLFG